ncbi:hypothetical protein [Phreatobacter sp.]|uniref:hypothetical protein n=1 Tax=Phreatobacter sp. TaxID=1966341 RepID=UPI0025CDAF3F|nr:hypothetical protein [Phreatobacter sp.]
MAAKPQSGLRRPSRDIAGSAPSGAAGNRGDDKAGGDEIGAGTFADKPSEPDDLTRGAPPKPKKRYSLAD